MQMTHIQIYSPKVGEEKEVTLQTFQVIPPATLVNEHSMVWVTVGRPSWPGPQHDCQGSGHFSFCGPFPPSKH